MKVITYINKLILSISLPLLIVVSTPMLTYSFLNNEELVSLIDHQKLIDSTIIVYQQKIAIEDDVDAMKLAYKIGEIYIDYLLEYNHGLEYHNKALKFAEELNDKEYQILILQQIGYVHYVIDDTGKAIEIYKRALKLAEEIRDFKQATDICAYLAVFLQELYRTKEAIMCYEKILKNEHNIEQGPKSIMAMGNYYKLKNNLDSTKYYYSKALSTFSKEGNYRWVSYIYSEMAKVSLLQNNPDEAFIFVKRGLDTAIVYDCRKERFDNYLTFSLIFEASNDYEKSLQYYKKYTVLKDSIYSIENKLNMEFLEIKLKLDNEKKEIALLKSKQTLNKIEIENKLYLIYVIISGFIILIFLILIVYYRLKVIKKQNLEIEKSYNKEVSLVKEKETLLKEIHHRVKNNMQIISSLLSLQQSTQTDDKSIELLEQSKYRIQAMAMVHEMLYQKENMGLINYEGYLKKLGKSLITALNVNNCKIDLQISAPDINLNIDTAVPLGLIINEILTNSLKYGFIGAEKGKIYVTIENIGNKKLILKIGDNGSGFDYEKSMNKKGPLGLQLIETLTEQLNGVVQLLPNKGTNYLISFEEVS